MANGTRSPAIHRQANNARTYPLMDEIIRKIRRSGDTGRTLVLLVKVTVLAGVILEDGAEQRPENSGIPDRLLNVTKHHIRGA